MTQAWIERIANAPTGMLLFVATLALVALFVGFSGLRRVRSIEDIPTARVRSAPQAYVELEGRACAMSGEAIVAPLSRTPCCWYRYRVEERTGREWRLSQSGVSDSLFLLRDETGDCVIDPEGAEITTEHKAVWFDDGDGWGAHGVHQRHESLGRLSDSAVSISGVLFDGLAGGGRYRYTESVILDGDPLYAIGWFRSLGADDSGGSLQAQTAAILREWKQRPDTLRARFDRNLDGLIDGEEWEMARQVAEREVQDDQVREGAQTVVHTLVKPGGGRFFLVSNLAEFGLLKRYRWRQRLGFGGFLMLGTLAALMLSGRF